ncbi:MAG: VWA domain-containing protein [Candidatus Eremiobacteraeota bacterium]|nr:VWA domain-containing protein [Candidatus Eremiobacteraeota bacterium]NNM93229.1 VWA domain-containing protein [Candidatus Eremiobacteraeota bacterium]
MSLGSPAFLLVAALLVAFGIWSIERARRVRNARDLAYSDLAFLRRALGERDIATSLLRAGWIVGLALAGLALARPHLMLPVPIHDGAVVLCIDTSGSMASTDIAPTRALAARAAARSFIEEMASGERVAIVAFSGAASLIQPLTARHATAIAALDTLPAPNGPTAIGDALALAGSLLGQRGPRTVVLVTDGVNNTGIDPLAAASSLGERGIHVDTVGIGTNSGSLIPGTSEAAGIDASALRAYARASGGRFVRVENASELRGALGALGRVTSFERKSVDVSLGTAFVGALLLALAALAALGWGKTP